MCWVLFHFCMRSTSMISLMAYSHHGLAMADIWNTRNRRISVSNLTMLLSVNVDRGKNCDKILSENWFTQQEILCLGPLLHLDSESKRFVEDNKIQTGHSWRAAIVGAGCVVMLSSHRNAFRKLTEYYVKWFGAEWSNMHCWVSLIKWMTYGRSLTYWPTVNRRLPVLVLNISSIENTHTDDSLLAGDMMTTARQRLFIRKTTTWAGHQPQWKTICLIETSYVEG